MVNSRRFDNYLYALILGGYCVARDVVTRFFLADTAILKSFQNSPNTFVVSQSKIHDISELMIR